MRMRRIVGLITAVLMIGAVAIPALAGGGGEAPTETSVSVECTISEDGSQFIIDMTVGEGAVVSIDGDPFGPGTYDGLTAATPGPYPWVAEVAEGYVLVGDTSGVIDEENCGDDSGDTKDISAKALDDHECDSSEWHFVITQIDSEELAPGSIDVEFSGGDTVTVPLDKFTGKTAHYTEVSHLDETVVSATASIYAEWDGQFNLSHGPCEETTTTTTTPEETTTTQPEETTTTQPEETTTTQPEETTTTTQPSTTTTEPETTTTEPEETTTTTEPETTTTEPEETTTTTQPSTTTTEESTTTTAAKATSTTEAPAPDGDAGNSIFVAIVAMLSGAALLSAGGWSWWKSRTE